MAIESVHNRMKTQGLQGCDKKQRSCDCAVHGDIETTLRIRGIEADISIPNGSAGMRRSASLIPRLLAVEAADHPITIH